MDAAAWDQRYADSAMVWGVEPNAFVRAEFEAAPPGRALDLAAGEGRNALWLAERGWTVTAVDFSSVAIDKGRRLGVARGVDVDWVVADVREYRPRQEAFDAVLIAYLHLPTSVIAEVLRRACAALAPGGVLFAVGHDVTNLIDGTGGPQDARILYSPEALAASLSGVHVDRAERVRRPVATAAGLRDAIDTVVRAHRPVR